MNGFKSSLLLMHLGHHNRPFVPLAVWFTLLKFFTYNCVIHHMSACNTVLYHKDLCCESSGSHSGVGEDATLCCGVVSS